MRVSFPPCCSYAEVTRVLFTLNSPICAWKGKTCRHTSLSHLTSETMLFDRSNLPLCQVSMFNTSPISTKCDITVRTFKLLRHIIPLEEFDRNCLQLLYALFFRLIHISPTFSERDVVTALSYSDKNHFEASISRKTNFKSSNWKWQRGHFRKLLEVARFSFRDVTMAKIIGTNKLPSSPSPDHNTDVQY